MSAIFEKIMINEFTEKPEIVFRFNGLRYQAFEFKKGITSKEVAKQLHEFANQIEHSELLNREN